MSRGTLDTAMSVSISDTRLSRFFAGLPRPFSYQSRINYAVLTPQDKSRGLGSFHFARRYFGNRFFFLMKELVSFYSSGYLDVSVHRVPFHTLWIGVWIREVCSRGFPHSEICGSQNICFSPQLIAACHVLRRQRQMCIRDSHSTMLYRSLRSI